ncbi:MAG: hypothetical protein WCK63_05390 [Betaproteobacteria bacterium]
MMSRFSLRTLFVYPLAALFNSFSMTALLLVVGVTGRSELAADVGLVQGATLALFFAFSANARNLILSDTEDSAAITFLRARIVLVPPLAGAAYFLSVGMGGAAPMLAMVLITRRIAEWMGEIGLARHERLNNPSYALQTLLGEGASLLLCLVMVLGFDADLAMSALPWMLVPLLAVRGEGLSVLCNQGRFTLAVLLPHFGSTAIIGASVYVFRISIVLVTGKPVAGELFTAFAIGGIVPTVFGQALAPTLVRRFGHTRWPKWLLVAPMSMLLSGIGVTALVMTEPAWLLAYGRSLTFWQAVGLSISGGGVMTVAAVLRTRLIHRGDGRDVFGPDLLANVLIATCVPFLNYLLGPQSLVGLYALSACLSFGFLWRAGHDRGVEQCHRSLLLFAVGALLVLPVFFQFNGGLFHDPAFVFDSGGIISRLPIPISVLALFGGIALLGNHAAATRTLTTLFFTALFFVLASLTATQGNSTYESAKLILLAQFLLPMFGLILGQMYAAGTQKPLFEQAALAVLLLIVPAQLIATWWQGYALLAPQVFVFSIYQHLQYFPMVVVALSMIIMHSIWPIRSRMRFALLMLMPLLAVYIIATLSIMAITGFAVALASLVYSAVHNKRSVKLIIGVVIICVSAGAAYLPTLLIKNPWKFDSSSHKMQRSEPASNIPLAITQRESLWRYYASGVVESPRKFLFGHAVPPDRINYPSAHNYWLDALYNFGALAMLPLVFLLFWTLRTLWLRRTDVLSNPMLFGAAMASVYLLLGENMLKVGMRQPYPGIITFFIWGLLIGRLCIRPELSDSTNVQA